MPSTRWHARRAGAKRLKPHLPSCAARCEQAASFVSSNVATAGPSGTCHPLDGMPGTHTWCCGRSSAGLIPRYTSSGTSTSSSSADSQEKREGERRMVVSMSRTRRVDRKRASTPERTSGESSSGGVTGSSPSFAAPRHWAEERGE